MLPHHPLWPALRIALLGGLLAALLLATGCRADARAVPTDPPPAATTLPDPPPAAAALPTPLPTATPAPTATPTPQPSPTVRTPLVVIDPGHGGEDWGACHVDRQGQLTLTEKEVNLAIALHTRDALEARGVRVYLMRDTDRAMNEKGEDVNGDGIVDPRDEVQLRVDIANEVVGNLLLSIHQNAFYYRSGVLARDIGGTVTYYCGDRPFSDRNLRFAELVQEHSVAALQELGYDVWDRGVRLDSELSDGGEVQHLILLGPLTDRIVRTSQMPGALAESLFMSNDEEAALLADDAVRKRLGQAYAEAVIAYLVEYGEAPASAGNAQP
ncbi:MAG TPA: N-acetylmuramoyl-L-alanine amidase [Armatimonadota bacterium]|nr:N-acetylmuramoyl-L-alanine amidase [Armatimonadota bacterium]